VEGVSGVCTYTSTDGTHFYGITGCDGTPDDQAVVGGGLYYMKNTGASQYAVYDNPSLSGSPIAISGGSGENHRLVPTDQAGVSKDSSNRFDPGTDVDYGANTITLPYDLSADKVIKNGDAVVYSAGGGRPIGG